MKKQKKKKGVDCLSRSPAIIVAEKSKSSVEMISFDRFLQDIPKDVFDLPPPNAVCQHPGQSSSDKRGL